MLSGNKNTKDGVMIPERSHSTTRIPRRSGFGQRVLTPVVAWASMIFVIAVGLGAFKHTDSLAAADLSLDVGGCPCPVGTSATGTWIPTNSMSTPRLGHSATLLSDGTVLVAGGFPNDQSPEASVTAELYDPTTGTWSATGSMASPRSFHRAIELPSGKVLALGGLHQDMGVPSAELYDPITGTWSSTGQMSTPRIHFSATLLQDGTVLVAGGASIGVSQDLASAEIYEPMTATWSPKASMGTPRYAHQATLLPDGRVIVAGGVNFANQWGVATAEVYDPATNLWSATGSMSQPRESDDICCHEQVLLNTGEVIAIGGYSAGVLDTVEKLNPAVGQWSFQTPMSAAREGGHTATVFADGTVLVVGGLDDFGPVSSAEVYDPTADSWLTIAPPSTARSWHSATTLSSGQVLVAGGTDANGALVAAELFDPSASTCPSTPICPVTPIPTPACPQTPTCPPTPTPTPACPQTPICPPTPTPTPTCPQLPTTPSSETPTKFQMPSVLGQDATSVKQTLLSLGLNVSIQIQETCDVPTNTVINQLPGPGTDVASGMTIMIVVAGEPPDGCGG